MRRSWDRLTGEEREAREWLGSEMGEVFCMSVCLPCKLEVFNPLRLDPPGRARQDGQAEAEASYGPRHEDQSDHGGCYRSGLARIESDQQQPDQVQTLMEGERCG
jgi:hypothetical protein